MQHARSRKRPCEVPTPGRSRQILLTTKRRIREATERNGCLRIKIMTFCFPSADKPQPIILGHPKAPGKLHSSTRQSSLVATPALSLTHQKRLQYSQIRSNFFSRSYDPLTSINTTIRITEPVKTIRRNCCASENQRPFPTLIVSLFRQASQGTLEVESLQRHSS